MIEIIPSKKEDCQIILDYITKLARFEKASEQVNVTLEQLEKDGSGKTPLFQSFILKFKNQICFLHCVSSYPATFKELNLNSISFLKNKFPNYYIGYSDHSTGIEACINAAALGAKVIEKHFTLSHNFSNFRDHQLSANPIEMKEMVEIKN